MVVALAVHGYFFAILTVDGYILELLRVVGFRG